MDRELREIIERLDALKANASQLGQKGRDFAEHIKGAEALLEIARKEASDAKREKGTQ